MIQKTKKTTKWWETVQEIATSKKILYIGLFIGILTYLFWRELKELLGFGVWYIGNAILIFTLCWYIFATDTKSFIKYVLFCLSLNNLCDELFFDPENMGINEIFIALTVVIFGIIKYKNAKRPSNY